MWKSESLGCSKSYEIDFRPIRYVSLFTPLPLVNYRSLDFLMDLTGGSNNEERQTRPGGNVIEAAADPTYEVRVTLVGGPHALRSIVSSPLINSLPLSPRSSRYFVTVRTGGLSFFTEHPFPADRDKARPGEEKVFLSHLKLLSLEMSTNQVRSYLVKAKTTRIETTSILN